MHNEYLCRIQKSLTEEQKTLTEGKIFDMLNKVGLRLRLFGFGLSASQQLGDQSAVVFGLSGKIPEYRSVDRV